ncbi:MAG: hypothetical protein JO072_13050 [Parafilimonas sp.]|nr:hypothetical protein [Parafilimonas sp.]
MRTFLLSVTLLITIFCKAQTGNLQIGAVTTFLGDTELGKNEIGVGGELAANIAIQKNISVGLGAQLLKFNSEDNLYAPVFATFKLNLPAKKLVYFLHADAGYGIHSLKSSLTDTADNGVFKLDFKNTGGLYLATGAGIKLKGKFAPYINVQYALYGFKFVTKDTDINQSKEYLYSQRNTAKAVTITVGIFLEKRHAK